MINFYNCWPIVQQTVSVADRKVCLISPLIFTLRSLFCILVWLPFECNIRRLEFYRKTCFDRLEINQWNLQKYFYVGLDGCQVHFKSQTRFYFRSIILSCSIRTKIIDGWLIWLMYLYSLHVFSRGAIKIDFSHSWGIHQYCTNCLGVLFVTVMLECFLVQVLFWFWVILWHEELLEPSSWFTLLCNFGLSS